MGRTLTKLRREQNGMNRFNAALEVFSSSYQILDGQTVSLNICEGCLSQRHLELHAESADLMTHGLCGCCGKINRVCDLELLKIYRAAGLSNERIGSGLPLLRQDFPTRPLLNEKKILQLIDAATRGELMPNTSKGPPEC